MFGRRHAPPQDLKIHIASTDSSPRASVALDEPPESAVMSEFAAARPLSVAIPKSFGAIGPYCVRRPNLSEILANESSPPWTLSAFMAYLSQNHCLETLEFTMDASRYDKHYTKMAGRIPGGVLLPNSEEATYLKMLWSRLMEAYIAPNGPREVNLPAELRNQLLSMVDTLGGPPPPSSLDNAVQHIYTLMEESVLLPFLNSYSPQTAPSEYSVSLDNLHATQVNHTQSPHPQTAHPLSSRSHDDRGSHQRSQRKPSPQGINHNHGNNHDSKALTPQSGDSEMADDLMSTTSTMTSHSMSHGSAGSVGLHTPPTTPPMGDYLPYGELTATHSPTEPHSPREAAWKRGMTKLGLRKSHRNRASGSGSAYSAEEE